MFLAELQSQAREAAGAVESPLACLPGKSLEITLAIPQNRKFS